MPFFIRKNESKTEKSKHKLKRPKGVTTEVKSKKARPEIGEEIQSDSDGESDLADSDKGVDSSDDDVNETAQEKRLRLAKKYLSGLRAEEAEKKASDDEDESTREAVSHRIRQQILEQAGRLQQDVAEYYLPPTTDALKVLRGHKLPVTCLVISHDDTHLFSASKDGAIIKWDMKEYKKVSVIQGARRGTEDKSTGHTAHVLAMAITTDGRFLATGDRACLIYIWNASTCERLGVLSGHRDAVSGLAFRKGSHQLFSTSHDKLVKIWNVDEMAYVETLYGHQDAVTAVDSLTRERAITAGGRDGSVRIWKVIEESQLVFHGHAGSIDCVALINEEHFVTGADDNSLSLWGLMKKKPLATVKPAHLGPGDSLDPNSENWITSVASLQHTDLIASAGCKDGCIKLWRCGAEFKSLHPLHNISVTGFVNSLKFSNGGRTLVAAIGQEHRLGRWWRLKEAKNSVLIISLQRKEMPDIATKSSKEQQLKANKKNALTWS